MLICVLVSGLIPAALLFLCISHHRVTLEVKNHLHLHKLTAAETVLSSFSTSSLRVEKTIQNVIR